MTPKLSLVVEPKNLNSVEVFERPEGSLLVHRGISSHLEKLGYPENSIKSMLRCGASSGNFINKKCGCEFKPIIIKYHCDLRTCSACSKRRKSRIFSKYLPFFKNYKVTSTDFFQFLTISPKNYGFLGEAFKDIRKNFSKFLRRKYIKDRIKAGFYILECVQTWKGKEIYDKFGNLVSISKEDGWNIHIHAVIYGSWLDYRIRGKCNKCNQNLLKFNKYKKVFYCANRKCGSIDVIRKKDTKLNREWTASSGSPAHIYGERVRSEYGAISYLTKYISIDKTALLSEKSTADYIFYTRKQKLISAFGLFYKAKFKKLKRRYKCQKCGEYIDYFFDYQVTITLLDIANKPPDVQPQKSVSS